MKLTDIVTLNEVDDEDRKRPPPITGGETISTSQAANILKVSVSRIRQLIGDGHLKPIIRPRKGDRDHELRLKDVQSLKDDLPKKGRPFGKGKGKDKDEDKTSVDEQSNLTSQERARFTKTVKNKDSK